MKKILKSGKIVIIYDSELCEDLLCKVLRDIDCEKAIEALYNYRDINNKEDISMIEYLLENGYIKVFEDIEQVSFDL